MRGSIGSAIVAAAAIAAAWPVLAEPPGKSPLPGRPVKVAAIAIGCGGQYEAKLKLACEHLEAAGKAGVDIACLPEEFAGTGAEPIPGPTTEAVAPLAKQYGMYVICPIREQAGDQQYNTAVLIDRQGRIAGYYRKVFVFWGEGLHCSREGVKAFDTDFGRIAILTCFDLNYAELWQECDAQNVDIVFWPSAYGGGSPLNAYAILHHYYVVPVGRGNLHRIHGNVPARDLDRIVLRPLFAYGDLADILLGKPRRAPNLKSQDDQQPYSHDPVNEPSHRFSPRRKQHRPRSAAARRG